MENFIRAERLLFRYQKIQITYRKFCNVCLHKISFRHHQVHHNNVWQHHYTIYNNVTPSACNQWPENEQYYIVYTDCIISWSTRMLYEYNCIKLVHIHKCQDQKVSFISPLPQYYRSQPRTQHTPLCSELTNNGDELEISIIQ